VASKTLSGLLRVPVNERLLAGRMQAAVANRISILCNIVEENLRSRAGISQASRCVSKQN
jgi:hypothetical protein